MLISVDSPALDDAMNASVRNLLLTIECRDSSGIENSSLGGGKSIIRPFLLVAQNSSDKLLSDVCAMDYPQHLALRT